MVDGNHQQSQEADMNPETNKALVRRFYQAFENNDATALNDLLAPDLAAYSHNSPEPQNRGAHVEGIRGWNAAFSDTRFTIENQLAEGDQVATLVTLRSVHSRGEFQGVPPTGRQIKVSGVSIERISDGKIAARQVISDWFGMLQQLGVVPPPPGK
jgi:steroid delta-isomerase-like uncharacterized protein